MQKFVVAALALAALLLGGAVTGCQDEPIQPVAKLCIIVDASRVVADGANLRLTMTWHANSNVCDAPPIDYQCSIYARLADGRSGAAVGTRTGSTCSISALLRRPNGAGSYDVLVGFGQNGDKPKEPYVVTAICGRAGACTRH